jgi:hypothetical protein
MDIHITKKCISARAGIRTRVEGVTVPHTGPDFTMQIVCISILPGHFKIIVL